MPTLPALPTTKLCNTGQGFDAALAAYDASLARLGLDYADLYLIHWPAPARGLYKDTWRALERLLGQGRIAIPKSVTPSRIRENLDVFGFDLDPGELSAIDALDRGGRTGPDPRTFNG